MVQMYVDVDLAMVEVNLRIKDQMVVRKTLSTRTSRPLQRLPIGLQKMKKENKCHPSMGNRKLNGEEVKMLENVEKTP